MAKEFEIKQDKYNNIPVTYGNSFITKDAAETPTESPLSLASLAELTLTVPDNAVRLRIRVGTADALAISEERSGSYYLAKINYDHEIDIAGMEYVYLENKKETMAIDVQFMFVLL